MAAPTYDDIQAGLDERYARFCLRPLTDAEVWALGMATMVMPDGNPGAEAYLSQVTGTCLFAGRLTTWGRIVAVGIASARYKAAGGVRRRAYVEGYDPSWGRFAVADGLTLALYGHTADPLGKASANHQGYIRIRDFVGGALVSAIAEFRVALAWATGSVRDRVLEGRWEGITGLNYRDAKADANMGRERGDYYPMFAPGCARISPLPDLDDYDGTRDNGRGRKLDQPETLYYGLRPASGWSDSQAAWTRKNCPAVTIYPATDE